MYCTELMAYFIEGLGTSGQGIVVEERHSASLYHFATTLSSKAVFRPEAERSATQTRCIMYSTVTVVV